MGYYVYTLSDPRDGRIFYVGKGKKGRIDQHEKDAAAGVKSKKCDIIREILASGMHVIKSRVSSHHGERDAYDAESRLIGEIGLGNLANVKRGGGGARKFFCESDDIAMVKVIAEFANRTRWGEISFSVFGVRFPMERVAEEYGKVISSILERRGVDFVRRFSSKFFVEFVA